VSWDELVAAALIGTDRRAVPVAVPEGSPPGLEAALGERGAEDRLLGAAAAWTVARRAGAMAGPAVDVTTAECEGPVAPGAAPAGVADDGPVVPGAGPAGVADDGLVVPGAGPAGVAQDGAVAPGAGPAGVAEDGEVAPGTRRAAAAPAEADERPLAPGTRLRMMIEGDHPSLLAEWLALVAERGLRPPPELVPDLLDHAAGHASLHAAVGAAAGPLGHWLAERAPRWAFVRGAAGDAGAVWADGEQAERRALLERLRRSDPVAALALLERTFAEETWEDRAVFVGTLAHGLSNADEPFLEAALGDKRKIVRTAAATLLAGLPTSRLAARMAERAAPLLHVEERRLRGRRLVAELPGDPDEAAQRDGVSSSGRRSERLSALLAATPLATWTGATSSGAAASPDATPPDAAASPGATPPMRIAATAPATPAALVALPVADDLALAVHEGWADAAIAQRDAEWARALWVVHPDSRLLTVLPKAEAESLAAAADAPDDAARALPAPWGSKLSKAVIDAIHNRRAAGERGQDVEFAGHRLDPAFAVEADERLRPLGGRDLHRLCDVLDARAAMLRELS
jgi:hypothetical protein